MYSFTYRTKERQKSTCFLVNLDETVDQEIGQC
jgi:hypothetical protein